MVDHLNVSYLYKKCGVYYFSKRVPNDLKSHYKTNRIVICLRTKSNISAISFKKSILQKLAYYDINSMYLKYNVGTIIEGTL